MSRGRGRGPGRWAGVAAALVVLAGCSSAGATRTAAPGSGTSAATAARATTGATGATGAAGAAGASRVSGLTVVTEPRQGMAPIDRFLASPRHSLDMTMYELVDARAESILAADAARGVDVRVVLDANRERSANTPAYRYLSARGVHVVWTPASYEATHEKAVVVDAGRADARALIMTLNLTARYYATTRDFAVIDTQPRDVAAVERVFAADDAHRAVTPTGGRDLIWSPGAAPRLVALIDSARTSLAVENEEMSSPAIVDALAAAARRGVRVEITMTADSEWDAALARLEAAGAHVRLYPDRSDALYIHAKVVVADGRSAFVGSQNFSDASLDRNRELGIVTTAAGVVSLLDAVVNQDFAGGGSPSAPTTTPTTSPTPTTAPAVSCHPRTDAGNCYEPGEYCRSDDHGVTGVAGDGQTITCEDVGGTWKWEAA